MSPSRAELAPRRTCLVLTVALALVVVACRAPASEDASDAVASGAESPTQAVEELVGALVEGDFGKASSLAVPGHAALASLAEGATFGQVADALRVDDTDVAANFWAGFAQGAGAYLTESLEIEEAGTVERDGVEYRVVRLLPPAGNEREMLTREVDGHRIDLFASFAPGLAARMVGPVERLLAAQSADSRLVLGELRDVVPSLLVAAERPDQPADVVQSVLRLVELITRVS